MKRPFIFVISNIPKMSRNVNQKQEKPILTKRMNRKDMDTSSYRLSRVPQKFNISKAVKDEPAESYGAQYYSQNPIDTRPLPEKLEDVESRLEDGELENDEKFSLLVQRKSLCTMIYGENSPEAVNSSADLGAFYNSLEKYESALRNLSKANAAAQQTELDEADGFKLALELADATLNSKQGSKQERHKQIIIADKALSQYAEFEPGTPTNAFRKDICFARIRAYRQKFEQAIQYYDRALDEYQAYKDEQDQDEDETRKENRENSDEDEEKAQDIIEPNLYVEAAQIAEKGKDKDKMDQWYRKAYDLYVDRGFVHEAKRIECKLPSETETEQNSSQVSDSEKSSNDEDHHYSDEEHHSDDDNNSTEGHHSDNDHHSDEEHSSEHDHHSDEEHHSEHDHHSDEEHHSDHDHHSDEEHNSDHDHHSDEEHNSDHDHHSDEEKHSSRSHSSNNEEKDNFDEPSNSSHKSDKHSSNASPEDQQADQPTDE